MFYILKVYLFILSLKYFTIIRLSHLIVLKYMKKAGKLPLINVIKEALQRLEDSLCLQYWSWKTMII